MICARLVLIVEVFPCFGTSVAKYRNSLARFFVLLLYVCIYILLIMNNHQCCEQYVSKYLQVYATDSSLKVMKTVKNCMLWKLLLCCLCSYFSFSYMFFQHILTCYTDLVRVHYLSGYFFFSVFDISFNLIMFIDMYRRTLYMMFLLGTCPIALNLLCEAF